MILLLLALFVDSPPDDDAVALLHLAAARQRAAQQAAAPPTYTEARQQAIKESKPLVIFVSIPARPIPGAITVSVPSLSDGTVNKIVVSDGTDGYWLSPTATDGEILAKMGKAVQPLAVPFRAVESADNCST